jgi:hypothetical protein
MLEQIVILKNGTVLHQGMGVDMGAWPSAGGGSFVTRVHLGPMADTQETAVAGGVVYIPNKQGHLLVLYPKTSPSSLARWQVSEILSNVHYSSLFNSIQFNSIQFNSVIFFYFCSQHSDFRKIQVYQSLKRGC